MCLRFGILLLLGTLCSFCQGYAQSKGCVDAALPSPVPVQKTKITIIGVEFEGETPLSDALRAQLVEDIEHSELWVTSEEPDSSWVSQALNPLREAILSQGYFRTSVEGTPYLVRAEAKERLYVLRVTIDRGPQYRLGSLRFASTSESPLVITDASLRQQIHLHKGDLFDLSKIRDGLEAIYKLYGSKGYIDATPEPVTTIDESGSRIDLLIKVDEERPYRIVKVALLGLNTMSQHEPNLPQKVGDLFDSALWENFFRNNKPLLPPDASPENNMQIRKDPRDGTLVIILDFRPCPKIAPMDE